MTEQVEEYEGDPDHYDDLVTEHEAFEGLVRETKIGREKLDDVATDIEGQVILARGELDATSKSSIELTGLRGRWKTPALAIGHYAKHKADTGHPSELAYLRRARDLVDSSVKKAAIAVRTGLLEHRDAGNGHGRVRRAKRRGTNPNLVLSG